MSDDIFAVNTDRNSVRVFSYVDHIYRHRGTGREFVGVRVDKSDLMAIVAAMPDDANPLDTAGMLDAKTVISEIAQAIWLLRREEEDRCDIELEDLGLAHSVWKEARAAYNVMYR